ncbi:MAG: class I tRNA ligase family protein [Thermodesulfobacteriota bacterium]
MSQNQGTDQAKLVLQNTMSRQRDAFRPRDPAQVRMFTCGPSVYNRPHLGNFRTYVFQDVLQRYLEYLGYPVQRVINFTDVEDKAVEEAKRRGLGLFDLTRGNEEHFLQEAEALQIKMPREIPRSSTSVEQAVHLIQILLQQGYAYWHRGCVFFDALSFPRFGRLFKLDLSKWPKKRLRFWRDTYQGNRWNLGDFILWHGAGPGESGAYVWDTEIGPGRPAWNIQDPAMISKHLGYELDICCGGVDNLYRHHDYNIAVMEAVSGQELAPYWLHTEHLLVRGAKMSKSKGNIIYVQDLLQEGLNPAEVRFYLLSVHYRSKMSLTQWRLARARQRLQNIQSMLGSLQSLAQKSAPAQAADSSKAQRLREQIQACLSSDLDVPGAVEALEQGLQELTQKGGPASTPEECKAALEELQGLDQVLRCLGLARSF